MLAFETKFKDEPTKYEAVAAFTLKVVAEPQIKCTKSSKSQLQHKTNPKCTNSNKSQLKEKTNSEVFNWKNTEC